MKKLLLIGLILGLFISYGCAQMAGQKAEGGMQKGQMMEQKGMMGHKDGNS